MNGTRRLLSVLLALLLVLSLASAVDADGSGLGGNYVTPAPWSRADLTDLYTVLQQQVNGSPGEVQAYPFVVQANVAKLHVVNSGSAALEVGVNGKRFTVGGGAADLDIARWVQYGQNTLSVKFLSEPDGRVELKVEAPALNARILHMNDIHAAIDPLPKAAAYVKQAKATAPNTYFVDAGDNFSGNPVSDLNHGEPMIQILNAMGLDVLAAGNHDFDHGPDNTSDNRAESKFPWLSANAVLVDRSATALPPFHGAEIFANSLDQKIAFIGLIQTPPATGTKNTVGFTFTECVAAAASQVKAVRDQVNLVVLVSHCGVDVDMEMADQVPGIDLIVGGHTHTDLPKPLVENGVPIVQAASSAKFVGDLAIRQAEAVTVTGGAAGGEYRIVTEKVTAPDPDVKAIVDSWNNKLAATLDAKIGHTPITLENGSIYERDAAIGNLMTDAMRWYMGADVAIWNNGGIRASIPAGDVTMRHVYSVYPFGNFIWKMNVTGQQLVDALAHAWERRGIDLQISGMSYTLHGKSDGTLDRIELTQNGQPVDLHQTFTLAVSDFIATGGDGYPFVDYGVPTDIGSDTDALILCKYIQWLGGDLNYKATEGRIKKIATIVPMPVSRLNFYNASSLLAAGPDGSLTKLTNQADVLVWAESSAYQVDRVETAPKNFAKVDAGQPIPLVALQQVGAGKVVGMGAIMISTGYKATYQNPVWFTNLLDHLTGKSSGTVLFDEGHGQYYDSTKYGDFAQFAAVKGYALTFTGKNTRLTAEQLAGADLLVISTPGSVGAYNAEELALLKQWLEGGGNLVLLNQCDYNNLSNPAEENNIAAAVGSVIRFNSDEIRDETSKDGTTNYSSVTNEFNGAYADLLEVR